MVIGKAFSSLRGAGSTGWRAACLAASFATMVGLGACNPVETLRDWKGASKNDPDPETTPNTQNLAAGDASGYPNLATVPPPPIRALTVAERDKLAESLIADRTNAKYSAEKLAAGFGAMPGAAPPPPPPIPAPTDDAQAKSDTGGTPSSTAASQPTTTAASGEAPAAAPAGSGKSAGNATAAGQGLRKSDEPPEPPPMESSLAIPQVRSKPNPQQVQTASPPPYPVPAPTTEANATPATPNIESPPAPVPLPAAIGSAAYQAPPPPPVLAPLAPAKGSPKPAPPAVDAPVAEIKFVADSTSLSQEDHQSIEKVAALYQQTPGKVRIVGYAGAGGGAAEQLNSFRAALDRAQAVAAALTEAGIPSGKIAVEAAPSDPGAVDSRAEVMLEH